LDQVACLHQPGSDVSINGRTNPSVGKPLPLLRHHRPLGSYAGLGGTHRCLLVSHLRLGGTQHLPRDVGGGHRLLGILPRFVALRVEAADSLEIHSLLVQVQAGLLHPRPRFADLSPRGNRLRFPAGLLRFRLPHQRPQQFVIQPSHFLASSHRVTHIHFQPEQPTFRAGAQSDFAGGAGGAGELHFRAQPALARQHHIYGR
jgi:hypothetical protein